METQKKNRNEKIQINNNEIAVIKIIIMIITNSKKKRKLVNSKSKND